MRFLLIEGSKSNDTQLSAFDSGDLILADSVEPGLMGILDFIERHPTFSGGSHVGFWEFVTSEVYPPEQGIYDHARRIDNGVRFLEAYVLEQGEPIWDKDNCSDQTALMEFREKRSLYALVPLRRGKPDLRVVSR